MFHGYEGLYIRRRSILICGARLPQHKVISACQQKLEPRTSRNATSAYCERRSAARAIRASSSSLGLLQTSVEQECIICSPCFMKTMSGW